MKPLLDLITDQRVVMIFCAGVLYQKLREINGDVRYGKKWRVWAAAAIMKLATKQNVHIGEQPE